MSAESAPEPISSGAARSTLDVGSCFAPNVIVQSAERHRAMAVRETVVGWRPGVNELGFLARPPTVDILAAGPGARPAARSAHPALSWRILGAGSSRTLPVGVPSARSFLCFARSPRSSDRSGQSDNTVHSRRFVVASLPSRLSRARNGRTGRGRARRRRAVRCRNGKKPIDEYCRASPSRERRQRSHAGGRRWL